MNKQLIAAAQQFLQRAQLSGHEVPTFIAVMSALNELASQDESPIPTPEVPGK